MKSHSINPRALGTASTTNAIDAVSRQPKPEVGMGATILGYTDRTACTIVSVRHKVIDLWEDIATRTDKNGLSESQDYTYATRLASEVRRFNMHTFTLRKDGTWVKLGQRANGGTRVLIGTRDHYIDPSF